MQVTGNVQWDRTAAAGQQNRKTNQSGLFSDMLRNFGNSAVAENSAENSSRNKTDIKKSVIPRLQGESDNYLSNGTSALKTLEVSKISLNYPPDENCRGIEALTSDVIADLKEKYDFQNLRANTDEFEKLICELKRLDVISEKDVQDMLLGQPMSFDENGQPTSWINSVSTGQNIDNSGSTDTGTGLNEFIMKWLKDMSETSKFNFEELLKRGGGNTNLAGLWQTKMNVCQKLSDIIGKIMAE